MSYAERFRAALAGVNLKTVGLGHASLQAYALNLNGHAALLVRVPDKFARQVESTRGITVGLDAVSMPNRSLRFVSEAPGFTVMFEAVVDSLLSSAEDAADVEEALGLLIQNFEQLRAMFASRSGRLSESAIRGLTAELLMLLELRELGFSAQAAVTAWQGPYRIAKDFVLPEARCIEVKSIRRINHRVRIASVEQLDPRGEDLRLAVIPIERCAPSDGVILTDLVRDVHDWIGSEPSAFLQMQQAFAALGFDPEDEHYQEWAFDVGEWTWFQVGENFPRVESSVVPAAVSDVKFTLDIDAIGDFATVPFTAGLEGAP